MRHGKKFNHLGRQTAHRSAMLSNMASSLIIHKRINTTVAKAKALRKYIDPILTKSKTDSTHSRRVVFSYLQDKDSVTELFGTVAEKIATRPGGYTRIIKTGARLGDNAEMCMMELVDFNKLLLTDSGDAKGKTRRSRKSGKTKTEAKPDVVEEVIASEEEVQEETIDVGEQKTTETIEEVQASTETGEVEPETSEDIEESTDGEDKKDKE